MRKRRIEILKWYDSITQKYVDPTKVPNYNRHHIELKQIQEELYELTGINQYQL